jgi:hypothetical protein
VGVIFEMKVDVVALRDLGQIGRHVAPRLVAGAGVNSIAREPLRTRVIIAKIPTFVKGE